MSWSAVCRSSSDRLRPELEDIVLVPGDAALPVTAVETLTSSPAAATINPQVGALDEVLEFFA